MGSGGQTSQKAETAKQSSKQDNPAKATQSSPSSARSSPERVRSQSRSRDRSGKARRRTWTLTSDSDVLSDLSDDVTSHPGCWLIPVAVEGVKTLALIDTGASVTMMGRPLYEKIQKIRPLRLQTHEMPRLEGVGGNPVPTLGSTEVGVDIGAGTYKATVMVSARKERPNFIIGADFLSAHDCDLSLREKLFLIGEQKIECIPEKARVKHAKLKLARRVELPPHTEVLVSCKAGQGTKYFGTPHMVAQPSGNSWRYAEDGLVIGSSLLARDSETHCIPVMNLSDAPRTLPQGARIGDVYPVTSLKQAHEVLEVDPQLSDWDSEFDSDDEELLDVRTTDTAGFSGIKSRSNTRNDARMDPKDLPEHLQPLMQDLADDLTL